MGVRENINVIIEINEAVAQRREKDPDHDHK